MSVILGESGYVELKRTTGDDPILITIEPGDITPEYRRFSVDRPYGELITGDQIEITSTDGQLLSFIDPSGWVQNKQYDDGVFYVAVDDVGAFALYKRFDEAVNGEPEGRIKLLTIDKAIPVSISVVNTGFRILGNVKSYELNTQRDAVDVTSLGANFKEQYSSLITGSGTISCLFDYQSTITDPTIYADEQPLYFHQLILRSQIGSQFNAKLTVLGRGAKRGGTPGDFDDEIWYDLNAVVTNVGLAFSDAGAIVRSTIEFITTGEIKLKVRTLAADLLLQEDLSRIELEANEVGYIKLEQQDMFDDYD